MFKQLGSIGKWWLEQRELEQDPRVENSKKIFRTVETDESEEKRIFSSAAMSVEFFLPLHSLPDSNSSGFWLS